MYDILFTEEFESVSKFLAIREVYIKLKSEYDKVVDIVDRLLSQKNQDQEQDRRGSGELMAKL